MAQVDDDDDGYGSGSGGARRLKANNKRFVVCVNDEFEERMVTLANRECWTISFLIRQAINEFLKKRSV